MALALSACSAHQGGTTQRQTSANAQLQSVDISSAEAERRIRAAYIAWRGTKHRLGGTTRAGIDCSALVQIIYRDQFGLRLPRTTTSLSGVGRKIHRDDLRAGDLVFFKPRTYPKHVGIYMSGGEFVHVSTKRGVMISRTDSEYWSKHYWTARRVLR